MREHKYRAWDTSRKKMYSAEELGVDQETLSADGRGFVNISGDSTRLSQFHTHLLPLEYTGLKDKNGKEGYLHDLVKLSGAVWQIVWDDYYVCYMLHKVTGEHAMKEIPGWNIRNSEIIGNIYENPELIKKEGE